MIDLVKFIISNIVDYPDDIKIEESVDESGTNIITLNVNPEDMGKVIGKGGKIISAVRELVKVKAIKLGKRVQLILKDPDQPQVSDHIGDTEKPESEPVNSSTQPEAPIQPKVPLQVDPMEKTDQPSQSEPLETPPQTS